MEKFRSGNFIRERSKDLMLPDWEKKLKENPIDLIEEKKDIPAKSRCSIYI